MEEPHQRQCGGEQSATKFDEARADEIADALDIAHDARDESAGLVRIVVSDWQAADVRLNFSAKLSNRSLTGFGKKLCKSKGSDALQRGRPEDAEDQQRQ